MKKAKVGLVLGKFMPLQIGHEFLLQFARQFCEQLVVVVDCLEGQTMTPQVRKKCIEDAIPGVIVVALDKPMPQYPEETPDFWNIWRTTLLEAVEKAVGNKPEIVVASETYGWKLAEQLGCRYIPCDMGRESVPISATRIRNDPMANWDYLSPSSREHFMKKVCFIGPESTGKSMCAIDVARYFHTVYVPEYAKAIISAQNGQFYQHNVEEVATCQAASEKALARMTTRLMVCDTDVLTTLIWSEFLYGEHPAELDELVRNSHYDITFLFEPDVVWVDDDHRHVVPYASTVEVRQNFLKLCKHWLAHFNRPYVIVKGTYQNRFQTCVKHCKSLIAPKEA